MPFSHSLRKFSCEFRTTHYERVAAIWDVLEALSMQPLSKVRDAFAQRLPFRPRNPLVAGCGTGRFPALLTRTLDLSQITLNDLAPEMLIRAVRRVETVGWPGRVVAIASDMTELHPVEPYDFVALQFVLSCFPHKSRARLIAQMRHCAGRNAIWLICDYSRPRRTAMLPVFYVIFFAAVVLFWCLGANRFELPGNTEAAILDSGLEIVDRYEIAGGIYTAWLARFP